MRSALGLALITAFAAISSLGCAIQERPPAKPDHPVVTPGTSAPSRGGNVYDLEGTTTMAVMSDAEIEEWNEYIASRDERRDAMNAAAKAREENTARVNAETTDLSSDRHLREDDGPTNHYYYGYPPYGHLYDGRRIVTSTGRVYRKTANGRIIEVTANQ